MTRRYGSVLGRAMVFLLLATAMSVPSRVYAVEDMSRIRESLNSVDWQVRLATVEKLRNARDEKTVNVLMEVVSTREERTVVKVSAIQLLGEAGDPRAIEVLLPIFNDATLNWECPALKSYTAMALGSFKGDRRVVDALISGINDQELLTREASIQSLGRIGTQNAVPHLIRVLNDEHVSIRLSAIKALGDIGNADAIPHIRRIADNEKDAVIRDQAELALTKLQRNGAHN